MGEHLLSLVQELETFASSDALPDLLCLAGEAQTQTLAVRGWRHLKTVLDVKEVRIVAKLIVELIFVNLVKSNMFYSYWCIIEVNLSFFIDLSIF